jgi:hypothetical protein
MHYLSKPWLPKPPRDNSVDDVSSSLSGEVSLFSMKSHSLKNHIPTPEKRHVRLLRVLNINTVNTRLHLLFYYMVHSEPYHAQNHIH